MRSNMCHIDEALTTAERIDTVHEIKSKIIPFAVVFIDGDFNSGSSEMSQQSCSLKPSRSARANYHKLSQSISNHPNARMVRTNFAPLRCLWSSRSNSVHVFHCTKKHAPHRTAPLSRLYFITVGSTPRYLTREDF